MSKHHDFLELTGSGHSVLWKLRGSNEPMTVEQLSLSTDIEEKLVRRELMYLINSNAVFCVEKAGELHFEFNPLVEWAYGVTPLVRENSLDELIMMQEEAQIWIDTIRGNKDAESVDEYAKREDTETDNSELVEWISAEVHLDWINDAISHYGLLARVMKDASDLPRVDPEDVEKQFVEDTYPDKN